MEAGRERRKGRTIDGLWNITLNVRRGAKKVGISFGWDSAAREEDRREGSSSSP